jgi:outer membrane receptor protein involved in Fe transport
LIRRHRGRRDRGLGVVYLLFLGLLVAAPASAVVAGRPAAGTSLLDALEWLEHQGLDIVYSTAVVTPDLRLSVAPAGHTPREILDEILAPHGLEVEHGAGDQLVIVRRVPDTGVIRGIVQDSIVVTPSRFSILHQSPGSGATLSRRDVDRLPHLTDDVYRVIAFLPGVAGGDISAPLNVRGGEQDEILILLDGQEVYAPFHFEDFGSIFSVVDTQAIGGLEFLTGGFTAEYGDRMSGVLDISTDSPEARRTLAGISFVNARFLSEGRFAGERGSWMASGRRGYLDLVLDLVENPSDNSRLSPTYYDLLGKVEYRLNERTDLALDLLGSYDSLAFRGDDAEAGEANANYDNSTAWLTLSTQWRPRLSSRTIVSVGRVARDRVASVDDLDGLQHCETCSRRAAQVRDERSFDFVGVKQEWKFSAGSRHNLKWGLNLRRLTASYDYSSSSAILDPLQTGHQEPVVTTRSLSPEPAGESYGGYLADRVELLPSLVLELGLRWDRQTYIPDEQLSPRLNLVYQLGDRTTLRAAWGRFYQSQGIHELDVADGLNTFLPAEVAEHLVIGLETSFASAFTLRLETYRKQLSDLQHRFENLLDPLNLIPEVSVDRVEIAPSRAVASGVEALLERHEAERWGFKLSYALASAEDEVERRWIARSWDQRQTLHFSVNRELGRGWNVNLAGSYHSGWPTTPVTARLEESADGTPVIVPVLGPRNSGRLPWFERLDARVARPVDLASGGSLTFFFEVMNLLNHRNLRGFSGFDFERQGDGTVSVDPQEEAWLPRIPSFGLMWSF